jgi:hypothetical protein
MYSDDALPSISDEDVVVHAHGATVTRDLAGLERPQELKNDVAASQYISERDLFLLPFPYAGVGFHGGSKT